MRKDSLQKPGMVPQKAWDDAGTEARKCLVELARRLGMDSSNSSLPPSSDGHGTASKSNTSESAKKKRSSGGQPGHRRHERPLRPTDKCDDVHMIRPSHCDGCGTSLEHLADDSSPRRHQVTELPEIKLVVTEYQQQRLQCPCCGHFTLAKLPSGVPPGQFGPGIISAVTMLGGLCRLSQRLTVTVLEDLFHLKISTGMISKLQRIGQRSLQPVHDEIAEQVRSSQIVHADETSWREANTKAWLWTAISQTATLFQICSSRSSTAAQQLLGEEFAGTVITDRYGSYNWIDDARRQFCWAHLLRDFQAMIDVGGEAAEVGERAKSAGRRLIHKWKQWASGKIQRSTFEQHFRRLRKTIFSALQDGLSCGEAKTEGTCCELFKKWDCLWTFTKIDGVAPTNNAAERAVRHGVIWRKLSQGTQSKSGSRYVETILSVLATCRQNTLDAFGFVHSAITAHLNNQPAPKILPTTP